MSKIEKIAMFDPNSVGDINNNIFGLPFTTEEADIVIIPVPWEVTVSYGGGTIEGPEAIYEASYQVDLYDPIVNDAWKVGIAMDDINEDLKLTSKQLRGIAEAYIETLSNGQSVENNSELQQTIEEVHVGCLEMNSWVKQRVLHFLNKQKVVGLIGGDHSTPLGMMQALSEKHNSYGILQIDAHADLRNAYEGFEFSHASIMYNALKIKQVEKLVQVGIRDYCQDELDVINNSDGRVKTFFDRDIKHQLYNGNSWGTICQAIINELPQQVYLSFDIDGLDPKLCPNTGTPVAGGFEAEQVLFLIEKLVESGKTIIAFDINEVSPGDSGDWDANVAARLLYRIANLTAKSQGIKP